MVTTLLDSQTVWASPEKATWKGLSRISRWSSGLKSWSWSPGFCVSFLLDILMVWVILDKSLRLRLSKVPIHFWCPVWNYTQLHLQTAGSSGSPKWFAHFVLKYELFWSCSLATFGVKWATAPGYRINSLGIKRWVVAFELETYVIANEIFMPRG